MSDIAPVLEAMQEILKAQRDEIATLRRELYELRAWVLEVSFNASPPTDPAMINVVQDARPANRQARLEQIDRNRERGALG